MCDLVRYENSEDGQTATQLHFLEAVHIFSISNMLHRPIIVLAEDVIRNKNGEPISVNDLYGIYLPILSPASECVREPIVLVYDQSHFCPLLNDDRQSSGIPTNLLPLYLSIDHIYDRILLPIRFIGDDVSAEHSSNLLHDYLLLRTEKFSFDSNSPPIYLLCAELGRQHLSSKEDFYRLYHKYVCDFFQVQKPKAIEEEQNRERERELEKYALSNLTHDTNGRSIIKRDLAPSPKISPRSNSSIDDSQSRDHSYEQRYSSDDSHNNGVIHTIRSCCLC